MYLHAIFLSFALWPAAITADSKPDDTVVDVTLYAHYFTGSAIPSESACDKSLSLYLRCYALPPGSCCSFHENYEFDAMSFEVVNGTYPIVGTYYSEVNCRGKKAVDATHRNLLCMPGSDYDFPVRSGSWELARLPPGHGVGELWRRSSGGSGDADHHTELGGKCKRANVLGLPDGSEYNISQLDDARAIEMDQTGNLQFHLC
ncbi:hypothetical protein MN608_01695 [Microdochium nivale]|nr:hypothetical protein MN608_01695 [Microdochium nivale]